MDVPAPVAGVAGELATHVVWQNELGGLTFGVGSGEERFFVKWAPRASGVDLAPEAARLRWAIAFTLVPRVLDQGADQFGFLARPYGNAIRTPPCVTQPYPVLWSWNPDVADLHMHGPGVGYARVGP